MIRRSQGYEMKHWGIDIAAMEKMLRHLRRCREKGRDIAERKEPRLV